MGVHRHSRVLAWLLTRPRRVRPMGLVAVQMSVNPFEFFFLIAVCLISVLYLVGAPPPTSVRQALPHWAVQLWAFNLAIGGFTALGGGVSRQHLRRSVAAYQFGWLLIGISTFVYGLTVLLFYPRQGVYPALSNICWGLACLTRVIQIRRFFGLTDRLVALGILQLKDGEYVLGEPPNNGPGG